MKQLIICALVGVVLSTPTITQFSSASSNVAVVNLPANDAQRIVGLPIAGSVATANLATQEITVGLNGANLPAVNGWLVAIAGCTGSACCNNLNVPNAVILTNPSVLGAATSFTSTPAQRSLYYAYDPQYNLALRGGELCLSTGVATGIPTGIVIRLYWSCQQASRPAVTGNPLRPCGSFVDVNGVDRAPLLLSLVSTAQYADLVFGKTTAVNAQVSNDAHECECINTANPIFGTCAGRVFDTTIHTCCGTTLVVKGDRCPCTRSTTTLGSGGPSSQCPSFAPNCCLPQKYPLAQSTDAGVCFNPTTDGCCDTGAAFDKGSQRCCPINGVQSLDIPCPCTADAHCSAGTFLNGQREAAQANMACCVQSSPALTDTTFCNIYVNFPTGTGDARTARCSGFCINTDYQLCCNGVACVAAYEKCCNTTCCNRFIGTCDKARRGPEFTVYETCSTIQQMNPLRAFWLFIFPAALLFATLTALALALIFANKAASREFSVTERGMIIFSVLLSILIIPLYFSPLYKYGLFMVLVASWTILTAAVRVKVLNVIAVALYVVLFIYLFDPFTGSQFLNLAYFRDVNGNTDYRSNGIWHTTKRLAEPTVNQIPTFQTCTDYFDYFRLDERLRDIRTDNYRVTTFGYCSNQYVLALYLFEGFQIICALVLTVLSLIGLVLRFRKKAADPIELQIVPQE